MHKGAATVPDHTGPLGDDSTLRFNSGRARTISATMMAADPPNLVGGMVKLRRRTGVAGIALAILAAAAATGASSVANAAQAYSAPGSIVSAADVSVATSIADGRPGSPTA